MNTDILTRYENALSKYDISQNKSARDIGFSAAALSQWRKGQYPGDETTLEESVAQWLSRLEQSHTRKHVPIVETDQLKRIVKAITLAHTEAAIALIVDDAGGGKTTAARYYAEHNSRTTILVDVVRGMNQRALLMEIARQLGLDTHRVNIQVLIREIAQTLAERDMVVILDEADYLKADALEFSRRLVYDLGRSGLVLMGLPRLTAAIQNLKNDHSQLESRIGVYLPLGGLTKNDAGKIVRDVWPTAPGEIVDAIYRISKTDVRQFTKIMERCFNIMEINRLEAVTPEVVEKAATMIIRRNWR